MSKNRIQGALLALAGIVVAVTVAYGWTTPGPAPYFPPAPAATQTAVCFDETHPVPDACQTLATLPVCPAEDDAIDDTPGPACWWISGEGNLWFNDGDGQR